ncbi:hypothetical protein ABPG72_003443 [Tetrahymena utriculariae]
MNSNLSQHKVEFQYQQNYSKKKIDLITIAVDIQISHLLSNNIYCLQYSEVIESLEKEDIICNNGQPIFYEKEDQSFQLHKNDFIEIGLNLSKQITDSKIMFKDAGLGLQNKLKEQDQLIQRLQEQIDEIKKSLSKPQINQIKSQLDILFLIGMPIKENQHDVSCEKEIQKIQSILYQNKIGCSICIVKTKESFKEMLSQNPQIIHVICHGCRYTGVSINHTLEIEDQKGEQQTITGQQFMKWIQKSNCNPSLLILNACYSQGIYEDMLRIKNNKVFNTLAINSEFEIDDEYAYKFVSLLYKKLLSEIKVKSQDKKTPQIQKENKIHWQKIIEETKQCINRNQLYQMQNQKQQCCINTKTCEFNQLQQNNLDCDCFKEQNQKNFVDYQTKHQNLIKGLTQQEFDYLKQFKNSNYPIFACQDHKYQQIVLSGPDFLTSNYPKLSRNKDIDDIQKILKNSKQKCQKDFSLKLNYYEQSKGRFLKYLTDIQSKSTSYKSQIHILNISGIEQIQDFQRVFLLDLKQIQKNIQGQNQIEDNKIHLFYFYNWQKCIQQINLTFLKGKQENIQLYIQSEEENVFDSLLFYSFTKDLDDINQNLSHDKISTIMRDLSLKQEEVKDYLKYCKNFDESISQKDSDERNEKQVNLGNITNLEKKKKTFENINCFLLNLIKPENFKENKSLYKYLLKNIMINCQSCHKIIQKKSLMKCLLKIILSNDQIESDNLKLLYEDKISKNQMNIQSLKGILNFLGIQYYEISPKFREVAKYIIFNETQPLDPMLVKSYLVGINFENKFHKEFRDVIKIHKRVLAEIKKCTKLEQRDEKHNLEEVEQILDYQKIKYYNKVARLNLKNQNLYYLSIKNAHQTFKDSILSILIQQRSIIRTISYIDFKKSYLNDIDSILNLNLKFQNNFTKLSEKKQRRYNKKSPTNTNQDFMKESIYILIQSTLLKELVQFLTKAQKIQNNLRKEIIQSLGDQNERDKNIIKKLVNKVRKMCKEFKEKYSDYFKADTPQQQHIEISFTAYNELELLIEQAFHEMKNIKIKSQIIQLSNIQLSCQDFYKVFTEVNDKQILNTKINQNLLQNFHDSHLFIQYYFKCPKELIHTYVNWSFSIQNYILENIYNRIIFTNKLFTKSNIQQIQKIQEFQKLKKIIIIDQGECNLFNKYEILDLASLNSQQNNQPTIKYAQQVELLIILNQSETYNLQQSIFKEKWVLCFNPPSNQNLKEKKTNFLKSLLQNIIKSEKVNFPLALLQSLSQINEDLKNQICFRCFQKENIEISNLCYSNNENSLNEDPVIQERIHQEDINNYLDNQSDPQNILIDILGKQKTYNLTITDSMVSFNFQEPQNNLNLENQNSDSLSNSYPQPGQLEVIASQNHYSQQQEEEEEEDNAYYSSQLQTEKHMLSYTQQDKALNKNF